MSGPSTLDAGVEEQQAVDFRSAATHWSFVRPAGWWTIPLEDPAAIDEHVRAVVVRRLGRRDDRALARRTAKEHLAQAAHGAVEEGGISLTVFSMDVGEVAITGTMAVFGRTSPTATVGDDLLASIVGSARGAAVDKQELDDGWVIRAVRQSEIHRTDDEDHAVLPELLSLIHI